MESNRVSNNIPGIGEVMSRKGTSSAELAGAASYWSRKYSTAWKSGWRAGFLTATVLIAGCVGAYLSIRF